MRENAHIFNNTQFQIHSLRLHPANDSDSKHQIVVSRSSMVGPAALLIEWLLFLLKIRVFQNLLSFPFLLLLRYASSCSSLFSSLYARGSHTIPASGSAASKAGQARSHAPHTEQTAPRRKGSLFLLLTRYVYASSIFL